jgi:phosphatidylinositol 4-kinase
MESVAEKVHHIHSFFSYSPDIHPQVIRDCVNDLNTQAAAQALPQALHAELRGLLVCSTHRIAKARDIASKFLNRLITSFPSLMCDPPLVFAILEVLTLLGRACENEFTDEVRP